MSRRNTKNKIQNRSRVNVFVLCSCADLLHHDSGTVSTHIYLLIFHTVLSFKNINWNQFKKVFISLYIFFE